MKNYIVLGIIAFFGVAFCGNNLFADPIGPDCTSCQGSIYTLTYLEDPVGTFDVDGNIWEITLTIDTSGYDGTGLYIQDVAIKASNSLDFDNSSLTGAPGNVASWALVAGGLNANGCSGSGSGFLCAQDGTTADLSLSDTFTWVFRYATTSDLFTDSLEASIKARYVDADGDKVGDLVSEGITLQPDDGGGPPIPEPTSLLLLGTGLAGLGLAALRKRNK